MDSETRATQILAAAALEAVSGADGRQYAHSADIAAGVCYWSTTRGGEDFFGAQFRGRDGHARLSRRREALATAGFQHYHASKNDEQDRIAKRKTIEYVRVLGGSSGNVDSEEARAARTAIERIVLGRRSEQDAIAATSGFGAVAAREPRCWALVANPRIYRIEDAVRDLDEDLWTTKGRPLVPGDRLVIWKAKGLDRDRGIVALGTVLTPPQIVTDIRSPYWLDPSGEEPEARVRVRYEDAENLPLWEAERPELADLPVAKARGGTVFELTSLQWQTVAALARLSSEADSDETTRLKRAARRKPNAARNRAVELRAMEVAKQHFVGEGWAVADVSATESYDLLCTKAGAELHVEVKGSSSDGREVALTRNEVRHAREALTALFIQSDIAIHYADDGTPVADGGESEVWNPWNIDDDGQLEPLAYSYRLSR